MCGCVCGVYQVSVGASGAQRWQISPRSPWTGVTDDCELLGENAWNRTQIFCKSNPCSSLLSRLSTSIWSILFHSETGRFPPFNFTKKSKVIIISISSQHSLVVLAGKIKHEKETSRRNSISFSSSQFDRKQVCGAFSSLMIDGEDCNKQPQTLWLKTAPMYFLTSMRSVSVDQSYSDRNSMTRRSSAVSVLII